MALRFFSDTFVAGPNPSPVQSSKGNVLQLALRPYVTSGIALVGASVIAISPITVTPSLPDIHVPTINASSLEVQLAGVVNPIGDPFSAWFNTAVNAVEGAVGIGGQVLGNGAPVLTQVLANQLGYLNQIGTAFQNVGVGWDAFVNSTLPFYLDYAGMFLRDGQIGEAFSWGVVYPVVGALTTLFPMIDFLSFPGQIAQNVTNVLKAVPTAIQWIGLGAILTLTDPLHAFGRQLQGLVDSLKAGDPLSAVNAVLNIPAAMTNAFMNGLLRPYVGDANTGLIGFLTVGLPRMIANAIKPPAPPVAPTAVESAPDTLVADIASTAISAPAGARTVTLTLDSKPETPAAETPVDETPAAETPVEEAPVAETPVDETPVDVTPVDETPIDETPVDSEPSVDDDDTAGSDDSDTDLSGDDKETAGDTPSGTTTPDADNEDSSKPKTANESKTSNTSGGSSAGSSTDSSGSDE